MQPSERLRARMQAELEAMTGQSMVPAVFVTIDGSARLVPASLVGTRNCMQEAEAASDGLLAVRVGLDWLRMTRNSAGSIGRSSPILKVHAMISYTCKG
jgi:hypothetical protein